jgi:hypothetical protein
MTGAELTTRAAVLCLNGWAGREEYPVEIVGETPTRYRVRLLMDVRLPGNRPARYGDIVLAPKYAIREIVQ